MSMAFLKSYRLFLHIVCLVLVLQLKSQTFSYNTVCADGGTVAPSPPSLPTGGTFTAPSGLSINPSTGVITGSTSTPGSYVVSYFGSSCNCIYNATVNVFPAPNITVNNTICSSGSGGVVTVSPTIGFTYTWLPIGANGTSITVPNSSPIKNFTVLATDPNGCKTSKAFSVTIVGATPLQVIAPSIICSGKTYTLLALGATNYSWSTGSTSSVQVINPSASLTFTVYNMDAPQCNIRYVRNLSVVSTVSLSIPDYTACSGTSLTLRANASKVDNVKFTWLPSSQSTADTLEIKPNASIIYTLIASFATCTSNATTKVTVITSTIPILGFDYNKPLCEGKIDSIPIYQSNFETGGSFSAVGGLSVDPVTGAIDKSTAYAGDYIVTYSVAQNGCKLGQSKSVAVNISRPVSITISGNTQIPYGTPANLVASGGDTYIWVPGDELSCTDCPDPIVTPTANREYCVGTYAGGCFSRTCTIVNILCNEGSELTVPSAFTPNGDGQNDIYCLKGWKSCNTFFEINIFDKWGSKVYSSTNTDFCWDGKLNGEVLPAGVYSYVIVASYNNQPKISKSGSISLIR